MLKRNKERKDSTKITEKNNSQRLHQILSKSQKDKASKIKDISEKIDKIYKSNDQMLKGKLFKDISKNQLYTQILEGQMEKQF